MRKKIWVTVFLFSLVFNVVFILDLLSDKHFGKAAASGSVELSAPQKKSIQYESAGLESENASLEKELEVCRRDLYSLLESRDTDRAKIRDCIETINEIQKKIQLNTIDQLLIYKKHMTPEQCRCFFRDFGQNLNVNHQADLGAPCVK